MTRVPPGKSARGRAAAVAILRLSVFPSFRLSVLLALPASAQAQPPKLHHLPATPETVAWGYYSAAAKPALRIASGDIVEVETLLTSTPERLGGCGVAQDTGRHTD